MLANGGWDITIILLTWTIWRAPTNASKWRMGFNSAFKGLIIIVILSLTCRVNYALNLFRILVINFVTFLTSFLLFLCVR